MSEMKWIFPGLNSDVQSQVSKDELIEYLATKTGSFRFSRLNEPDHAIEGNVYSTSFTLYFPSFGENCFRAICEGRIEEKEEGSKTSLATRLIPIGNLIFLVYILLLAVLLIFVILSLFTTIPTVSTSLVFLGFLAVRFATWHFAMKQITELHTYISHIIKTRSNKAAHEIAGTGGAIDS